MRTMDRPHASAAIRLTGVHSWTHYISLGGTMEKQVQVIRDALMEAERLYPTGSISYNQRLAAFERHAELLLRELRLAGMIK